jgi:hypothetical protein
MINKFNEKTGKQYCYKQPKNKCDNLKKEWNIWGVFSKGVGLDIEVDID